MKKVLLSRTVDSSVYSFDTISEDSRLGQVHGSLLEHGICNADNIDDHRLLSLTTLDLVKKHAAKIADSKYDIIIQFVRQPSACIDFTRRWLQILQKEYISKSVKYPQVFLAGDVNVGYSIFFDRNLISGVLLGDEDDVVTSIQDLNKSISFEKLSKILFKNEKGIFEKIFKLSGPRNISNLPHGTLYVLNSDIIKEGKIQYLPHIRATRGCYAHCSFCHESISNYNSKERHIHVSINWLEKEIERLHLNGVKEIIFQDSNFLPRKNLGDLWINGFTAMMRGKFPNIQFSFWTRAEDLTENRMILLSQTKVKSILIGVESLLDERLKYFKKGLKKQDIVNAIRLLHKYNIEGKLSFILFQPDLQLEELNQELIEMKLLFENYPNVQRNPLFAYNLLIPHPDTELYNTYRSQELLKKDTFYNFEEHFTYMSGRKVGSHVFLPNFQDQRVALLCEAFRLFQYEYSKKWFTVIRANRDSKFINCTLFLINLPDRMIYIMLEMLSFINGLGKFEVNKKIQKELTDLLYSLILRDYSSNLPKPLRYLETPNSINYSKEWKSVVSL